ncbi:MAG: phosphoribosylglycinamide formyltransferase [Rickettsiales bacterium]
MTKRPVAVLASGRGSNFQALAKACASSDYPARIVALFSDRRAAPALEFAKAAGIPTQYLSAKDFATRGEYDLAVSDVLAAYRPDFLCLAGYMRLLSPSFVKRWEGKIVNVHPSLLPSFKGLRAQAQALEAGVKIAGCTVHIVTEEMDAGPIIAQSPLVVEEGDTEESLSARLLPLEHAAYVKAVRFLAEGRVKIENGRATILRAREE